MAVIRINHFKAAPGRGIELLQCLKSAVPLILNSAGCISCRALQHEAEAEHIIVLEEWENAEAHKAALRSVPQEAFSQVMILLAEPPHGSFYQ